MTLHEDLPARGLDRAFADVRTMLERDGFGADWDLDDNGGVHFRVIATVSACHECLVPEPVMMAILADALVGTGYEVASVALPGETGASEQT
ncbi:MAG: hypothetical protein GEV09_14785 [Pseudonocardiaceae bacterium]|nr:hypothetical protein [Pseudonocardiaceae bacterium]